MLHLYLAAFVAVVAANVAIVAIATIRRGRSFQLWQAFGWLKGREPEAQQGANKIKSEETKEFKAEVHLRMADVESETEQRKNERLKDKERLLPLRWKLPVSGAPRE